MLNKKFIKNYEQEVKQYREEYYRNIILNSKKTVYPSSTVIFSITLIIAFMILFASNCSVLAYIEAISSLIVLNILIYIFYTSRIEKNEYLEAIKRQGFFSIESYENKLKKYITGPKGSYNHILLDLMEKYNINSSTKKIVTTKNEEFYIWSNSNRDKIYLLNSSCNERPEPIIIPISDIRYFRVDYLSKNVILKTANQIYNLKPDMVNILNELIKDKRLENIKIFDPAMHINDYEIYMHKVKKGLEKDYGYKREKFDAYISNSICLLIIIAVTVAIGTIIPNLTSIINIVNYVLIILLNLSLIGTLNNIVKVNVKSERDILKEINSDPANIEVFRELKYVLGINEAYDKVYTKEGAEYITWVANGYFHVFLNIIYFNSVYMVVKTSDVKYYKSDYNSCQIKLKDKTLEFTKQSKLVFDKILPNKDYDWIKNYQKN